MEAGFDPRGIVYAGVGKRDKELRYAISQGILAINCESIEELMLIDRLSAEAGRVTDVALRINPDIDPKTNHCIDTGQADSKFGISYEEVLEHATATPSGRWNMSASWAFICISVPRSASCTSSRTCATRSM